MVCGNVFDWMANLSLSWWSPMQLLTSRKTLVIDWSATSVQMEALCDLMYLSIPYDDFINVCNRSWPVFFSRIFALMGFGELLPIIPAI
ncbi:hypothetical protein Ancab_001918 [Ancistrocladus abbreviatus]